MVWSCLSMFYLSPMEWLKREASQKWQNAGHLHVIANCLCVTPTIQPHISKLIIVTRVWHISRHWRVSPGNHLFRKLFRLQRKDLRSEHFHISPIPLTYLSSVYFPNWMYLSNEDPFKNIKTLHAWAKHALISSSAPTQMSALQEGPVWRTLQKLPSLLAGERRQRRSLASKSMPFQPMARPRFRGPSARMSEAILLQVSALGSLTVCPCRITGLVRYLGSGTENVIAIPRSLDFLTFVWPTNLTHRIRFIEFLVS